MLTLRHILLFEALAHKSFTKLDGKNVDDVLMLMYVCKNDQRKYTYRVWSEVYKKYQQNDVAKFGREISEDIEYCNQFQVTQSPKGKSKKNDNADFNYTDVIGRVITDGGMDAEWVLSQTVEMLPILAGMTEDHEERKIDNERFWAFVLTSPYRDKKSNCRTPEKWLPMPFDKKRHHQEITKDEAEQARKIFAQWRAEEEAKKNGNVNENHNEDENQ